MPSAQIKFVSVNHNIRIDDSKGMDIHVGLEIRDLLGEKVEISTKFFTSEGEPLKGYDHRYIDEEGCVAINQDFIPPYHISIYPDFDLFIPYKALYREKGQHELMFKVSISDKST